MKNLPIRWQLAAFYTALITIILLVLGLLLYANMDSFLVSNTAASVVIPARNVIIQQEGVLDPKSDKAQPPDPSNPAVPAASRPPDLQRIVNAIPAQLAVRDVRVLALVRSGQEVGRNGTDADKVSGVAQATSAWPPIEQNVLNAVFNQPQVGQQVSLSVQNFGGERILSVYLPVHQRPQNDVVAVVVVSVSMAQADAVLLWLRWAIPAGVIVAVLLCFLLGVPLARALLRPLGRVVGAANRIAVGDFSARTGVAGRNEVGQLAQSFDSMAERVQSGFAAQRQFVADASHELKTPLTALSGEVEMLQTGADGGNPAARHRLLSSMERELGRMSRLVADLLTLSRLDSEAGGSIAPTHMDEQVDLAALCREVAEQTAHLAPQQQVTCDVPPSPAIVCGNADRLRQVLLNLADNARKFTTAAGNISINLRVEEATATVSVSDNGIGIAPADLPHIFDRFYRSDPARTRAPHNETSGSGLGLAIAQAIAQAHGGNITVTSAVGEGSEFKLMLPLIK